MNCMDCRFYDGDHCKRYPPQTIYIINSMTNYNGENTDVSGRTAAIYPLVNPFDWCGEFKRKPKLGDLNEE